MTWARKWFWLYNTCTGVMCDLCPSIVQCSMFNVIYHIVGQWKKCIVVYKQEIKGLYQTMIINNKFRQVKGHTRAAQVPNKNKTNVFGGNIWVYIGTINIFYWHSNEDISVISF